MPDSASEKAAKKELLRLRGLPENRVCANCLKEDEVGFKSVVVPFKTFVCSSCKSAHQGFSHLCKTADMSTWTMEQVKALDEKNGGGNRLATERWMSGMPDSERPGSSDTATLEALKKFIERVYMEKRWETKDVPSNEKVKKEKKSKKEKKEAKEEKRERGIGEQWENSTSASTTAGWSDYPSLGTFGTGGSAGENWGAQQLGILSGMQGSEQLHSNRGGNDRNGYAGGYHQSGYVEQPGQSVPQPNSQSCGLGSYGYSTPQMQHAMPQANASGNCSAQGQQASFQNANAPAWGNALLGGHGTPSSQFSVPRITPPYSAGQRHIDDGTRRRQMEMAFSRSGPAFLGSGHVGASSSNSPCFQESASRPGAAHTLADGPQESLPSHASTSSAHQEMFQSYGHSSGGDHWVSPAATACRSVSHVQLPAKSDLHSWRGTAPRGVSPVLPSRSDNASFSSCRQRSLPPPTNALQKTSPFSRPPSTVDQRSHHGEGGGGEFSSTQHLRRGKEPLTLHATNPWAIDLGARVIPVSLE